MTIKFARRVAAELTGRGENSIRIAPTKMEDVRKAMTRDDVRKLLKDGSMVAVLPKHNLSLSSKKLKIRRSKGRGRGPGHRKGSFKARQGGTLWIKKSRSQRMLLKKLRSMGKIDRQVFNTYYMLIKGNTFADKASLILHLREEGITVSDAELAEINAFVKAQYNK